MLPRNYSWSPILKAFCRAAYESIAKNVDIRAVWSPNKYETTITMAPKDVAN